MDTVRARKWHEDSRKLLLKLLGVPLLEAPTKPVEYTMFCQEQSHKIAKSRMCTPKSD